MRPMGTTAHGGKGQGKGKGRGEGRLGHGGRGRSKGGEKLMGTTAYGGKGSKGRAANGDRPVGAASCRRDHHTMASCQKPLPTPSPITDTDQSNCEHVLWGPCSAGHAGCSPHGCTVASGASFSAAIQRALRRSVVLRSAQLIWGLWDRASREDSSGADQPIVARKVPGRFTVFPFGREWGLVV